MMCRGNAVASEFKELFCAQREGSGHCRDPFTRLVQHAATYFLSTCTCTGTGQAQHDISISTTFWY